MWVVGTRVVGVVVGLGGHGERGSDNEDVELETVPMAKSV